MRLFVAGFNQAFALTLAATEITGIGGLTVYPAAQATIIIVPPVRLTQTTAWFGWLIATAETGATYLSLGYQGGCAIMTNTALPAQTGAYLPYGFFPIARPFVIGANLYLPTALMLDKTSLQGTVFLLQQTPALTNNYGPIPLPVATSAPRQLDLSCIANMVPKGTGPTTLITGPNHIAFGAVVAPTTYQALAIRTMGSSSPSATVLNGTTGYSGLGLAWDVTLNFHSALQFKSDELNGQLHISGGTPFVCDGQAVSEDNFFYYPEFAFTGTAGTGTTLPTGSYQYAVCYAYADSCGNIARSAPVFTDVRAITNGGAYPTVTFPQLVTWRDVAAPGQTYAEIYRTLTSPAAPVYYLLDRVPCSLTTPQSAAAAFLTYADNLATNTNAALETSSILYTTGGVLDNVCPPASNGQAIHKGRLWAIDDSLQAIWFTQQSQVGAAPGYNESLTIGSSDVGDITALQSMDSELVIFKRNSIWVMYGGDGPASTGTGADEQIPQRVPSDVGCADWRSVVLTPVGIMFAAPTGIYLLDRSLNVTWIGRAVQDLFASYPTCVGAVLVPGNTQVRFAMQSVANTLTTILVYDYVLGQWAQHSYGQQLFGATSLALSQSGVYSLETTDGSVWQENANNPNPGVDQYLDQDSAGVWHFSPTSGMTAEIKITGPGDLQRYQRVRIVQLYADWLESSQITLGLAFNGVPTQVASRTWTAGQLQGLPYDLISMSVPAAYTRCMSVQVLWSDSADAVVLPVTGQGVRWAGLALEIEALAGRYPQIPKGNR